jgi:predicted hydrocarbon binding protein
MIRDTFETNPGLCELFKRKIVSKALCVGLSPGLIDFDAQIDMKGSYQDNLRTFYREYPQLAQESDYSRLKQPRPLTGAALEESWLSYALNKPNEAAAQEIEQANQFVDAAAIVPELTVTYSIGPNSPKSPNGLPESVSTNGASKIEANQTPANHSELVRLLLDRVTAMAGEGVTKTILHQVGKEIGRTAFHHSGHQISEGNLAASLDRALRSRGLGRVQSLERVDHVSSVTFTCTVTECSLCGNSASKESTCDIMRGILSRWLESLLHRKAERIEETCVDAGSHRCVFKLTFRK